MNAPIRRLAFIVSAMFCALLVSTTWIQFVQAGDLDDRAGNRRTLMETYSRERGAILVDGNPIARSQATDDDLQWIRSYPDGRLYSHVTGYYSFIYGAGGGVESARNELLAGTSDMQFYRRVVDVVTGRAPQGASLELTLDPDLQEAADQALGDRRGAVVAIDPDTGAVLAMVSHPQYDPAVLSSHQLSSVEDSWNELTSDPARPMVNRTIAGDLYPPGSTFKLVTAAAALSSGDFSPDTTMPGPATYTLPQTDVELPNYGGGSCSPDDEVTLERAVTISCNTAFAWLGNELGDEALRQKAQDFGFGQALRVPMPVTPSVFPEELDPSQTAQAAIGQYDVRMTPLQVAMMSAAIANEGAVMSPYLISTVRDEDLDVIEETSPQQVSEAVSPTVAGQLEEMMVSVVEGGSGGAAALPGVTVAAKTGTAEYGSDNQTHAWFTGYAPVDDPQIAIAVIVEGGGTTEEESTGGRVAAPVARQVLEAGSAQ